MKSTCIIPFTDESKSFTNGVEFGRILNKMEQGLNVIDNSGMPIHLANKDVIKSACIQYGYAPFFGKEHYGEWIDFHCVKGINNN